MAANVKVHVLDISGRLEREETVDNVQTVEDVRDRMGLQKGAYQLRINKDASSDSSHMDSRDRVSFCPKGVAWPKNYLP
jgi:hypothetical protein